MIYIDEGYSMTRTEAPKDFEGRGWANLARTTPELPREREVSTQVSRSNAGLMLITVGAGDLAPDDSGLGATNLLLGLVDEGNALAEVEAIDTVSLRYSSLRISSVKRTWHQQCRQHPRS
jgi:hypothetical protein